MKRTYSNQYLIYAEITQKYNQLEKMLTNLETARKAGNARKAEVLQRIVINLTDRIAELETQA